MLKVWKNSRLRFYILNARWNYGFWIFAKKVYKDFRYQTESGEFVDTTFKIVERKNPKKSRRFIGYMYKGRIYQDNPGMQNIDADAWRVWRKKGLID